MSALYPDQLQALADAEQAYADGFRAPIIVAVTGWGKTHAAAEFICRRVAEGRRVWFLAHLEELLLSTADRLDGKGIAYGWIWRDQPTRYELPVHLVSLQTAVRRLDTLPRPDLVIIDECDLAIAASYQRLLDHFGRPLVLGLTGTPVRADGRPMREGGFDHLVRTQDLVDLVDAGRSPPIRIWSFPVDPDLAKVRRRGGDLDPIEAGRIMSRPKIMGDSLEHWQRLCVDPDGRIRPTAAFCHDVRSAEALAQRWREAGYRAMHVSGTSPTRDRRWAREGLQGGGLDLVASADMWLAGVDIPEIAALLVERGTESLRVWLQMVGRGLRKSSAWPDCYLLDHVGNCRRPGLGDPLARRMHLWSLDDGCGRRVREAVPPVAVCEACYSTAMVGRRCLDCGHEREAPKVRDVVLLPGQLAEFPVGQDERRQRREQEEQERKERTQARKAEERACWNPADPSGTLARFFALAKKRQAESGQDVDPVRALRWAKLQISFRNGSRYPQHRQPVAQVRRARV
jgi:hypothetical protein